MGDKSNIPNSEYGVDINKDGVNNSFGGLSFDTTEDIETPDKLIDQVIGQEDAKKVIKKAANKGRNVLMIGSPGTGKSMLAKAMSEMMPSQNTKDVVVLKNEEDNNKPRVEVVDKGRGEEVKELAKERRDGLFSFLTDMWVSYILAGGVTAYGFVTDEFFFGILSGVLIIFLWSFLFHRGGDKEEDLPNVLIDRSDEETAPFEDATQAHAGALFGDVNHDPFQSGDLAVEEHQRVEPGNIHRAHNGVLYIDEINTLQVEDQQKLLTAIQDGEFEITGQSERSAGAMVQTQPVPSDFALVAAGNMDAIENMHPALRSRFKGYGYEIRMDDKMEDTPQNRRDIVRFVAQEVQRDGDVPHFTQEAVERVIVEARRMAGTKNKLTLELRDLGGVVRSAGDKALDDGSEFTRAKHVRDSTEIPQSIEGQAAEDYIERKEEYSISHNQSKVGSVNGLAVMGEDSGILLPVMANVVPAQGNGEVVATGQLKEMAEESVQNVSAIIKEMTEVDLSDYDIHIQFVQVGRQGVDGDSASVTVATAVISSLIGVEIDNDVAMTGSLSVRGDVLPVGGVTHKIEAAIKSGCSTVIIPKSNKDDVLLSEEDEQKINIVYAERLEDVIEVAFEDSTEKEDFIERFNDTLPPENAFSTSTY